MSHGIYCIIIFKLVTYYAWAKFLPAASYFECLQNQHYCSIFQRHFNFLIFIVKGVYLDCWGVLLYYYLKKEWR